jgi:hypothetical protein
MSAHPVPYPPPRLDVESALRSLAKRHEKPGEPADPPEGERAEDTIEPQWIAAIAAATD